MKMYTNMESWKEFKDWNPEGEEIWVWRYESEVQDDKVYEIEVDTDDVFDLAIEFDEYDDAFLIPLNSVDWV